MLPGFVIQLRVHHAVQDRTTPGLRATNTKTDSFFYVEQDLFLSYHGMMGFLSNILANEGIPVDTDGRFLCQNLIRLLRPNVFSQSVPFCSLQRLVEIVLDHAMYVYLSQCNRFRKLVPLAMDLTLVRNQPFHFQLRRVDEAVILGEESSEAINSKRVVAPAKLVEGLIQVPCTEKDCSICLENFSVGQLAVRTPCSHMFHKKCIARWMIKSQSCPLCRADLSKPV